MTVVRRVVTEEVEARSRVALDTPAPETWCAEIWTATREHPLGFDPGVEARPLDPPPGTTAWRLVSLPPDDVVRATLDSAPVEGVGEEGFHRTSTIDYVFVLDGDVELVLDYDSVVIRAGDCVVQRETNHVWRNHNDHPVRLLVVMVSTR